MKKILISVLITFLISSCQISNETKDEKAIKQWILDYQVAVWEANIEKLLSFVSNTVVYLPPNGPSFSGKENLRKWYLDYFNYYSPSEVLSIQNLGINGDFAYLHCNYSLSAKENHSGKEFTDDGKLINIFQRQPNGEWKIINSIWNSNHPIMDLHAQIPADFSGNWKLDLSRSTVIPDLLEYKMLIVQNGSKIQVNQTTIMKDEEPINSSLNYTIGTIIQNHSDKESTIQTSFWSSDKHSFTVINELHSKSGKSNDFKRITSYSITAKGETLNIISDDILPEGVFTATKDRHIEMIFNKE